MKRRRVREEERCCLRTWKDLRDPDEAVLGHGDVLRQSAPATDADHDVAPLQLCNGGASVLHDTAELAARHERPW